MYISSFYPWQHVFVKLFQHLIKNFFLRFSQLWLSRAEDALFQDCFKFFKVFVDELAMEDRCTLFKAIEILGDQDELFWVLMFLFHPQ